MQEDKTKKLQNEILELKKENERNNSEIKKEHRLLDKYLKELSRQIGGLTNKFGSFAEAIALPSMEKVLKSKFEVRITFPNLRKRMNGSEIEYDLLGLTDESINLVYVVEIKSNLKYDDINHFEESLSCLKEFFPEYANRQIVGIMAAFDFKKDIIKKVNERGFYFAQINDDVFTLKTPSNFKPKYWN